MGCILTLDWSVRAPVARVFDLCRSVDAHLASTPGTNERPVGGTTSGLLALDDEVTWRARHLGVTQELTSKITIFEPPHHFRDTMTRGIFRRFDHDHYFRSEGELTHCRDVFAFAAPLGPLGWLAERLFLKRYMRRFLTTRLRVLTALAETPAH